MFNINDTTAADRSASNQQAQTFLQTLLGDLPDGAWAHLWRLNGRCTTWVNSASAACTNVQPDERDVYVGVGLTNQKYGLYDRVSEQRATGLLGLIADIDIADASHKAENLPPDEDAARLVLKDVQLEPTLLVHSGHGLHAWWLFTSPWLFTDDDDKVRARTLSELWNRMLAVYAKTRGSWKLDAMKDFARVLRIPGTINTKDTESVPVRLLACNSSARYDPDYLLRRADVEKQYVNRNESKHLPLPLPAPDATPDESLSDRQKQMQAERTLRQYADKVREQGAHRNPIGFDLACQLRDIGLTDGQARAYMRRYCADVEQAKSWRPAYEWKEAQASLEQAFVGDGSRRRDPPRSPNLTPGQAHARRYARTQLGNAERLLDQHSRDIRYSSALGFCTWDVIQGRWRKDNEATVQAWAEHAVRSILVDASKLYSEAAQAQSAGDPAKHDQLKAEADALYKWGMESQRAGMFAGMLKCIQPHVMCEPEQFDANPWLFNCPNGTIDLKTGELRSHRQEDYLTQRSPIAYNPNATCPTFDRFLREVMCEREELVDYLWRAFGYSMTGDVSEQVWHLLLGEGENGKSTLMETLEFVLGEYAATMEAETITSGLLRDGGAASPDLADLKGKRFTKVTETEEGARLAAARIKKLSGGDSIKARFLHKNPFTFYPTHKIFVYTNHKPQARERTHAFWRRVRYVPFDFKPAKKDTDLPNKLRAEADGVLAALVRGCMAWQQRGLAAPMVMVEARDAYQEESNVIKQYLEDNVEPDALSYVRCSSMYEHYSKWCWRRKEKPESEAAFGIQVRAVFGIKSTQKKVNGMNMRVYVGLHITDPEAEWVFVDRKASSLQ